MDRPLGAGEVRAKAQSGASCAFLNQPLFCRWEALPPVSLAFFSKIWERFSDSDDSQSLPESGTGLLQMTREEARAGRRLLRCFVFWMDLWVALRKASLGSNWDR